MTEDGKTPVAGLPIVAVLGNGGQFGPVSVELGKDTTSADGSYSVLVATISNCDVTQRHYRIGFETTSDFITAGLNHTIPVSCEAGITIKTDYNLPRSGGVINVYVKNKEALTEGQSVRCHISCMMGATKHEYKHDLGYFTSSNMDSEKFSAVIGQKVYIEVSRWLGDTKVAVTKKDSVVLGAGQEIEYQVEW
jgi:hypothetical protein